MRAFKTSKKNRTNYTYYTATGEKITITPDDVGDSWIAILHETDDTTIDADRREKYHAPISYDAYVAPDGESEFNNEKIKCMEDMAPDPLEQIIEASNEREHEEKLERLRAAIQTLQPQQIDLIYKSFYAKRTNVDIAAEEGVTEAAIRKRLKKIYASLYKKLAEFE